MTATSASSLPPVRTSCHVPLSLMTSISEETIALWLKLGALEKLEQAVLDGYGDQLCGKTSRIPQVNKFLKQVPLFQSKIREIHQSVSQGRLRDVQHLIDRKKLAFCRDHNGASPLHKAVIFGHQDVIEYLAKRYGGVIHIRDHQGRTALHYAAFLPDRGEIYQYLLALGADERAMDVYGRQPSYYLDGQNESTLRQLRDGSTLNGIRKIKPRYYGQATTAGQPFTSSNKSTVTKSQIREIISDGDVGALEDLVLQGQGDRLLGETSVIPKVQSFLNIVPMYMERIYDVHRAVMRDQLEHVVILLENRKLALARDQLGATPLHKAVWFGHYKIAHFISHHFEETLNAIDLEGRTALHYAAALKDNKNMYGILIEAGANKGIYDNKGKTADYYSQYPEHLNLEEVIKRCHKVNANYLANTASRIKGKSPVRQTPPPSNGNLSSPRSEENNGSSKENSNCDDSGNDNELISMLQKDKFAKRLDINSANIRKWVSSKDVEKLTKAVMEGYGDKVVRVHTSDDLDDKDEITTRITEMVDRVNAIHTAVSSDDLNELQSQLDEKDFALAKDHMGMTPLHKAVLLRKTKIVGFLIEKFPETINAKNKNGLTALHYSAAMSRKDGQQLYKMLLQAGADPKIRDNHGRTPDYYKTHLITLPNKGIIRTRPVGGRATDTLNRYSKQGVLERMTTALQRGDVDLLQELVLEGHGKHLLGKTSWHEEVKTFLKELPAYLNSIQSFHEAIQRNDLDIVRDHISANDKILKARDDFGSMPIHLAAMTEPSDVLQYFAKNFPNLLNLKDATGKTALHIIAQRGNHDLYKLLKLSGADAKILDLKGKQADYYLHNFKPDSGLPKPITNGSKVSPNTSSDSMYSNSSREDMPKTPAKFLKRKSSKSLVSVRKQSTVEANANRKNSMSTIQNGTPYTNAEKNQDKLKNDEDVDNKTDPDTPNDESAAYSRESEANQDLESKDDEKIEDALLEEDNEDSSGDVAPDDEANEETKNEKEEVENESGMTTEMYEEDKEVKVEEVNEVEKDPDESNENVSESCEDNERNDEESQPPIDKSESRKNSNVQEDEDDTPNEPDDSEGSKDAEDDSKEDDVDTINIDPPPEDENEIENVDKDENEGDNETDKDTIEAEDSISQSEESNATVIEATPETNCDEDQKDTNESKELEDDTIENPARKLSQRLSIDETLLNIHNFEGKTVAEVGSGNINDSLEINEEPLPDDENGDEGVNGESAETKQSVDDAPKNEDPDDAPKNEDPDDAPKEDPNQKPEDQDEQAAENIDDEEHKPDDTGEAEENNDVPETPTRNLEESNENDEKEDKNEEDNQKDTEESPNEINGDKHITPDDDLKEVEIPDNPDKNENNEDTNEQVVENRELDANEQSGVNHEENEQSGEKKEENEGNQENENLPEKLTNNSGNTSSSNISPDTPTRQVRH
ncbi:hypothetical protein JTE90_017989 [Oedothorax gibbosus]|uniref:Uncharacterized protein n=1 Tax=Oedothorax gibbosus TaxID=931172 RepID=A0AAV6V936_9ARAC|nr:hypothetical protein JTE90_017989 [Oedothorax gibbosus]